MGKSKLSLDLAERLNGEIVNADSMQIYKGNEGVMTAKPTIEEKSRVPHHLYDVVDMQVKDFNVNKYLDMALPCIEEILSRGKLPVVVGGTNYYIEGLLFEKDSGEGFIFDSLQFDEAVSKLQLPERFQSLVADFKDQIPPNNKALIEEKYA